MKISCNWLREYANHLPSPDELSHALTMCGLEVEETQSLGSSLEGVVVGRVERVQSHPGADRLVLCQVNIGEEAPVQIVCGAPNVAAGQRVPVARVGTRLLLPDRKRPGEKVEVKIRKSKIRGEVSLGMICAEDELGLSSDHSGILVLDEDAAVGTSFSDYLQQRGMATVDTMLDIAITPNRPDAICHIGIARDVTALYDLSLQYPHVDIPERGGVAASRVDVDIECPDACRRYVAILVEGVTVGESPAWMKQRLETVGLRPINNIVDITNYVMMECGQPLHAFDFDHLKQAHIVVRQAAGGESFTTLDGRQHAVPVGTVLICDGKRPVALGGMMGGANSEVEATTTTILIESAWFDPSVTRKAAKTLGIATDASYRFERGVDPEGQAWAAARAAALMVEFAGGTLVPGMVDCYSNPMIMPVLELRLARITQILGIEVLSREVARILRALGFGVEEEGIDRLRCRVPSFRPDVTREIDIIEEVARIYGYDAITEPTKTPLPSFVPRRSSAETLREGFQTQMVGRGYREIVTNSLLSKEEAEIFNDSLLGSSGSVAQTLNAVSQTMTTLRPSLLPGLLQTMGFNQNHGQQALRFYEFGHVFHLADRPRAPVPGYDEREAFILGISGPDAPVGWDRKARLVDFFDLKGDVEALLEVLRVPNVTMTAHNEATALAEYHLTIFSKETRLGYIACVASRVTSAKDLRTPVYAAELDWSQLVHCCSARGERTYRTVGRYPVVDRDIAVIVGREHPVGAMQETIRKAGGSLLRGVTVFDIYEDERIGDASKSVAFALRFGADRTLKDAEVDACVDTVVKKLHEAYGAQLRQ